MMMKVALTKHMAQDRLDRYARIATEIGFGRTVMTTKQEDPQGREPVTLYLTSTGVLIIRNSREEIVTMYCPTAKQVMLRFNISRIPNHIYTVICDNHRKGYCAD